MALEVAVRNPERYESVLNTFAKCDGDTLDDEGILKIYTQLYLDDVVSADSLANNKDRQTISDWIVQNCSHNNEWGFPTGYQAAFTRYLKTLSEFGFIYAQYGQPLRLSPIAKALVCGEVTLSESFALQSMRFWRKSPYRRVLNDYNFFEFMIDSLIALKKKGHHMSYNQFVIGLFSDDGDVDSFLDILANNKVGNDENKAYSLIKKQYSGIDDEHAKVPIINTVFRDYGNTVFRVLQLTGFITVDYDGTLLISPNENRMSFYNALKFCRFQMPESAKEDEIEYFETIGSFDAALETLIVSHRDKNNYSTCGYNRLIPQIIASYNLDKNVIEQALLSLSTGRKRNDVFWFVQDPVKFEFLLTLFVYLYYGDSFQYKPNYICDEKGIPYSHAPGNIGDIEIFNNNMYWLIEATLIRAKTQQINNETVNLFRHIDKNSGGEKYLTLVAPYIHDDTRLIFNVASVITMLEQNNLIVNSVSQTIDDFVSSVKQQSYFDNTRDESKAFMSSLKDMLNRVIAE